MNVDSCVVCGENLHKNKRFCSIECKAEYQTKNKIKKFCEVCGEKFKVFPCNKNARFCSSECKDEWHSQKKKKRVWMECEVCGEEFEIRPCRVDRRRTCSYKCSNILRSKEMAREKNPNWQGGKGRYYGQNWPEQRRKALERDSYKCQICGAENDLTVHHKIPIKKFDKEEVTTIGNNLDNLVTLCRECHSSEERNNGN